MRFGFRFCPFGKGGVTMLEIQARELLLRQKFNNDKNILNYSQFFFFTWGVLPIYALILPCPT